MLKRRSPANGRPGLKGTIPSRFIEPEREDRPNCPVAIKQRPQSVNCLLQSTETARVTFDDPAELALEVEDPRSEIFLQRVFCLPSPTGQNGITLATDGAHQAIHHTKGTPQAAATSAAAIQEHDPVRRANHLLHQSPIRPQIGIATSGDIRMETGKTNWHRLVQKLVLRSIRIPGSQGSVLQPCRIDPAGFCP